MVIMKHTDLAGMNSNETQLRDIRKMRIKTLGKGKKSLPKQA
jgi:hypothetical protein